MAHYVIAQIDIKDREKYAEYEAGFMDVFTSYKGKLLSADREEELTDSEMKEYRKVTGKISWLANSTRPDLRCFLQG